MLFIIEYRRVMAYFRGDLPIEELSKKELKYAKKCINSCLRCQKAIDQLKQLIQIQRAYEDENNNK